MTNALSSTGREVSSAWETEVRTAEQAACTAFLAADIAALDTLWADCFAVNSPLQRVLAKAQVLEALRTGRIRHLAYEFEIEQLSRHGDVAIVMGNDCVMDPPDGMISRRRFTNLWQLQDGEWRAIARHAHVVSREAQTATA